MAAHNRSLVFAVALSVATGACAQLSMYSDTVAGYSVAYPTGWAARLKQGETGRSMSLLEPNTFNHGCLITAYPAHIARTQEGASALLPVRGMSSTEWLEVLSSDGYRDVKIVSASRDNSFGGLPANFVEFTGFQRPRASSKGMFGHWIIHTTVTPSRVWHFACSAISPNPEDVEPLFRSVRSTLVKLYDSFRFSEESGGK
jgi:hypothetical protein